MTTQCQHVQESLLRDLPLTPQAQTHLDSCRACQRFAETMAVLPLLPETDEPPAELDQQILAAAARRPVHQTVAQTKPKLLLWRPLLLAAAAMVVLAVGIWLIQQPDTTQPPLQAGQPQPVENVDDPVSDDAMLAWDYDVVDSRLLELEAELVMMREVAAPTDTIDQVLQGG